MTAHRKLAALAALGVAPLLALALASAPAAAHGALENPVSRASACGTEGGQNAQSAACQAAVAVSSAQATTEWDNLRLPNVVGRDREVVPDGKLCSAGLSKYRGLDLARADWPTTTLSSGADFTFKYRGTIPHKGKFKLYVTKDGYQSSQPLRWSDLQPKPFLTATDPKLKKGSYTIAGKLPEGKTGRHLIYTIWQNSDTPDTYYSCSDVAFTGAPNRSNAVPPAANDPAAPPAGQQPVSPPASQPAVPPADQPATAAEQPTTSLGDPVPVSNASPASRTLPYVAGAAALLLFASVAYVLLRRRRANGHRP